VAFGKGTYTSLPLDCRFEQQNNVVVVQYERMTSHVAACEQCGDFSFECDWRFSGQLTSLRGQTKQHVSVFDTAIWFADGLKLILPAAAGAGDDLKGAQQDRGAIRSGGDCELKSKVRGRPVARLPRNERGADYLAAPLSSQSTWDRGGAGVYS
jgi:hypothetical protein